MAKSQLKWWVALLMVVLYVLLVFIGNFIGFAGPAFWVFSPLLCTFLGVGPFFYLAARWQNFGVGTCISVVMLILCAIFGEANGVLPRVLIVAAGVVSDFVRLAVGNGTQKGLLFAYPIFALGNISMVVRLWTSPDWYYQGAVEEMGLAYADGLVELQSPAYLVTLGLLTLAVGIVAVLLSAKVDRKSAALLS